MKEKKTCSFCGRGEGEVSLLITGLHGYICNECAEQAHLIVKEALGQNSLESAHLPGWMLKAIPFLGFTIQIGWFLGLFVAKGLFAARVLSIILSIILLVCYIKVIKAITANTIALNSLATNDGPTDIPDTAASYEPSKATPSDELDRGSPDNPQRPA